MSSNSPNIEDEKNQFNHIKLSIPLSLREKTDINDNILIIGFTLIATSKSNSNLINFTIYPPALKPISAPFVSKQNPSFAYKCRSFNINTL